MDALTIIVLLFASAVHGAVGCYIMKAKGRSEGLGFVLGLLLGVVGLVIVLSVPERRVPTRTMPRPRIAPGGQAPKPAAFNYPVETMRGGWL